MDTIESKCIGGRVLETKLEHRNGVPIGIMEVYIATWDIDEPDFFGERDRFVKGAFAESLSEHRERDNRQVRMKFQHHEVIGGFPIDFVKEDDVGLFARGEINLDVPLGASTFALAKQGVLVDMSIGFVVEESDTDNDLKLRTIQKAKLFEGSVVDEPRNRKAKIISVKSIDLDAAKKCLNDDCELEQKYIDEVLLALKDMIEGKRVTPFLNLPVAETDTVWDASAAVKRVREFTGSEEEPSAAYRRAFLWFDADDADAFGAYKLPYADVIDGKLTTVPRAINNAKARLGQTNIPAADKPRVLRNIERYQEKFQDDDDKAVIELVEVKDIQTMAEVESLLTKAGFSHNAAKALISKAKEFKSSDQRDVGKGELDDDQRDVENQEIVTQLKNLGRSYSERPLLLKLNQLTEKVT